MKWKLPVSVKFDITPIPDTLLEAVDLIVKSLTAEEVAFIQGESDHAMLHHTVGMAMRNGWQLWQRGTALHEHFRDTYGLGHADDMSGLIMAGVWARVRGEEHDVERQVKRYKKHWTDAGEDPLMEK